MYRTVAVVLLLLLTTGCRPAGTADRPVAAGSTSHTIATIWRFFADHPKPVR
jgi:hypothetical protein